MLVTMLNNLKSHQLMMQQEDYIMRIVEQSTALIAELLQLKKAGDCNNILALVDQAYNELLSLDPKMIEELSEERLIKVLKDDYQLIPEQFELLGQLLIEEGELLFKRGIHIKAKRKLIRAILILEHVSITKKVFSFDREDLIQTAEDYLDEIDA